jgi:hypothetical protein
MSFISRMLVINLVIYLKISISEQNMLIHLMPRTNETKNYKLQVVTSTNFWNNKWNITLRIISCKLQLLTIHQTINKTQNQELWVANVTFNNLLNNKWKKPTRGRAKRYKPKSFRRTNENMIQVFCNLICNSILVVILSYSDHLQLNIFI